MVFAAASWLWHVHVHVHVHVGLGEVVLVLDRHILTISAAFWLTASPLGGGGLSSLCSLGAPWVHLPLFRSPHLNVASLFGSPLHFFFFFKEAVLMTLWILYNTLFSKQWPLDDP